MAVARDPGRRVELAEQCFLNALADLRDSYHDHTFWAERDVVYWMQLRIRDTLSEGLSVFNDYGLLPGPRRSLSADLVIVDEARGLLACEFKFEPARSRRDIQAKKLPVLEWINVDTDIARIQQFVTVRAVPVAWSVCVDEGGRYRTQARHRDSRVEEWDTGYGTQVTVTRYPPEGICA